MTENPSKPRVPRGLGSAGKDLWRSLLGDVAPGFALDQREMHLLEEACRSADHLADLEAVLAAEGVMATGSAGQVTAHPALIEARQQRVVLVRLLTQIDFGAESGEESLATRRASHAAQSRWNRPDQIKAQRAAIRDRQEE